ncbi:MAG: DUF4435 domain-containing protein [Rikenellaceae bacterium]|nr:DUF4435 domain-containing protein [Rikenellaceae bacterium]
MTKLTDAVSSKYFDASAKLRGKKYKLVKVFVEGYDDISFWRCIFDQFEDERLRFEISVPTRGDLAKGKKVVMSMIPNVGDSMLLCVDSDFDYLFGDFNEQSRTVNNTRYLFQTYTYATENYLCYPPSLRRLCVRATKNDSNIFDFEEFMKGYSRVIYPLFIWYAFSARKSSQKSFTLADFRNIVRIHYVELRDNGEGTLSWLQRHTDKKLKTLERHNSEWIAELPAFEKKLRGKGVTEDNVYFFMQGHTLKDNVVVVLLQNVCDKLREISNNMINNSERRGLALKNELSNYNNSLRNVKDLLNENTNYKNCFLYKKLERDIREYKNSLNIG